LYGATADLAFKLLCGGKSGQRLHRERLEYWTWPGM